MTDRPPTAPGQLPIELILLRQVASYLAMPMLLVDVEGDLVYFNEPAGELLGRRFEDEASVPMAEWVRWFNPADEAAHAITPYAVSVLVALHTQQAAHDRVRISGRDGEVGALETTAFPLQGQGGRMLGAVALFWPAT